jgi:hypothetical protein
MISALAPEAVRPVARREIGAVTFELRHPIIL